MSANSRIDWSLRGGIEVERSSPPPSSSSSDSEDDALVQPGRPAEEEPDFLWALTEEPHRSRRKAILKAHPEVSRPVILQGVGQVYMCSQITKLMGYEPRTKYVVLAVVALQLAVAYALRSTPFFSWTFMLAAYAIGGTANQNLFLAIHEITHNLAFRGIRENRLFAILANLPIGIPYAMLFKRYHIEVLTTSLRSIPAH
jgi:sphingolipid delta-4 desaturase